MRLCIIGSRLGTVDKIGLGCTGYPWIVLYGCALFLIDPFSPFERWILDSRRVGLAFAFVPLRLVGMFD